MARRSEIQLLALRYIIWSDDGQRLSHKDLELSIQGLRQFIRLQVSIAQDQLQSLLLIGDETRAQVIHKLWLQDIKDNPALS